MKTLLIFLLVAAVLSVIGFALAIIFAPEGEEDEDGFHLIKKKKKDHIDKL